MQTRSLCGYYFGIEVPITDSTPKVPLPYIITHSY
jgi:hypothetical protein